MAWRELPGVGAMDGDYCDAPAKSESEKASPRTSMPGMLRFGAAASGAKISGSGSPDRQAVVFWCTTVRRPGWRRLSDVGRWRRLDPPQDGRAWSCGSPMPLLTERPDEATRQLSHAGVALGAARAAPGPTRFAAPRRSTRFESAAHTLACRLETPDTGGLSG